MATTLTLAQLRTAVRQRADMENLDQNYDNSFIKDDELNSYINQSYFELYDLLVQKYGDNYYVASPYSFTTNGSSQFYDLPSDFYKLLGVDLALSNTLDSFITIKPFNFIDRNRYAVPNFQSFYGITNLRYKLNGNQLWLTPIASNNQTIRVWYVPRLTTLVDDTDTADGISGWTEYIITDCVIKCLQKEESDPSVAMAQKQALIQRIEAAAENRDAGSPATVGDSQYSDFWWPNGGSSGGYY
jgi:hypothetical protein